MQRIILTFLKAMAPFMPKAYSPDAVISVTIEYEDTSFAQVRRVTFPVD